jgi:hypothetical protein
VGSLRSLHRRDRPNPAVVFGLGAFYYKTLQSICDQSEFALELDRKLQRYLESVTPHSIALWALHSRSSEEEPTTWTLEITHQGVPHVFTYTIRIEHIPYNIRYVVEWSNNGKS